MNGVAGKSPEISKPSLETVDLIPTKMLRVKTADFCVLKGQNNKPFLSMKHKDELKQLF